MKGPRAIARRKRRSLVLLLLFAALASGAPTGCAVIDKDHRLLTRIAMTAFPDEGAAELYTAPLWVPVGTVTLVADGFGVNPALAAPQALDDGMIAFTGYGLIVPAEIVLTLPRAVGFVVLFVGSEIGRCTIPYIW
ncbi:hypothetical protein JW916_05035 [Candidatus Sumerlaeota bacterium]|nr:hypothetical protein [Candidatus Sumerlaeota bacterium]